jgi:hypothetical protein
MKATQLLHNPGQSIRLEVPFCLQMAETASSGIQRTAEPA